MPMPSPRNLILLLLPSLLAPCAFGQQIANRCVVIPQRRAIVSSPRINVSIQGVRVKVEVLEQVATTTMDISLKNNSSQRVEAELLVPVPGKSVVRGFNFQGSGLEPSAKLLPAAEARGLYQSIVSKMRDPALLEFVGYNLIKTSIFPIEPQGEQTARLIYEQVLVSDGGRVDYVIPRSEAVDYRVPWDIEMSIKSSSKIATVYSPSHSLVMAPRKDPRQFHVKVREAARTVPGPFQVSYLLENSGPAASLLAYPNAQGGGYFLLLAGLPLRDAADRPAIPREVTLVLDRSGSMAGEKMRQVQAATRQIISGLDERESFNIISYNEAVHSFLSEPARCSKNNIVAAHEFIEELKPRGGTNIHDALHEALRQPTREGVLPIVIFLTDGLPTIGNTDEEAIRELVSKGNKHGRRVFTIGVGADVNSALLENIAYVSRSSTSFVLPGEDVELKIASLFRRLSGPILSDPTLEFIGQDNRGPVEDVLPGNLPDMFDGDQLVVLGRYRDEQPLSVKLEGNYLGEQKVFEFEFEMNKATVRNHFVPRLWASRKVGVLVDAIRSSGASGKTNALSDPKLKELVDEVVRLSTEFGILTEYTSFLAREGTDLSQKDLTLTWTGTSLQQRAQGVRTGLGAINQDLNSVHLKCAVCVNPLNRSWNSSMNRVEVASVQQVCDKTFYLRNNQWVDGVIAERTKSTKADRIVEFGSVEHAALVNQLIAESRQAILGLSRDTLVQLAHEVVLVKQPQQVSAPNRSPSTAVEVELKN